MFYHTDSSCAEIMNILKNCSKLLCLGIQHASSGTYSWRTVLLQLLCFYTPLGIYIYQTCLMCPRQGKFAKIWRYFLNGRYPKTRSFFICKLLQVWLGKLPWPGRPPKITAQYRKQLKKSLCVLIFLQNCSVEGKLRRDFYKFVVVKVGIISNIK